MGINKFIHQIWLQGISKIPKKYESIRVTWIEKHPDWYYRMWDISSLYSLLKNEYPQYIYIYEKLIYPLQKIHFFQYLLMYHYGGMIPQIDMVCVKNMESLFGNFQFLPSTKFKKQKVSIISCCVKKFQKKEKNNLKSDPILVENYQMVHTCHYLLWQVLKKIHFGYMY